jgi:hypothetical protein
MRPTHTLRLHLNSDTSELDDLEAEGNLPLEELLAKYGMQRATPGMAAVVEEEDEDGAGSAEGAGPASATGNGIDTSDHSSAHRDATTALADADSANTPQKRPAQPEGQLSPDSADQLKKRRRVDTSGGVEILGEKLVAGAGPALESSGVHAAIASRLLKE